MNVKNSKRNDFESRIVAQTAMLLLAVFGLVVLAAFRG